MSAVVGCPSMIIFPSEGSLTSPFGRLVAFLGSMALRLTEQLVFGGSLLFILYLFKELISFCMTFAESSGAVLRGATCPSSPHR